MAEKIDAGAVREAVLDGRIGAISIDTCIFVELNYGLEYGNLKQLYQFRGSDFKFVLSDIVIGEMRKHMLANAESSVTKLNAALGSVGKTWGVDKATRAQASELLFGGKSKEAAMDIRLREFFHQTGVSSAESNLPGILERVLRLYFGNEPPFEGRQEKKAEFPDAFTLISLEEWAKKRGTALLLVTKDKGVIQYCLNQPPGATLIYVATDLSQALALIQDRDVEIRRKADQAVADMLAGKYGHVESDIEDALASNIWDIDWHVTAHSPVYFEDELEELVISEITLKLQDGKSYRPVGFREGVLTVQTAMKVKLDATCDFHFSTIDGIDRDQVSLGSTMVERKVDVDLDILLHFQEQEDEDGEPMQVLEFEIVRATKELYFGDVLPYEGESEYED